MQKYIIPAHIRKVKILPTEINAVLIYRVRGESKRKYHVIDPKYLAPSIYPIELDVKAIEITLPTLEMMWSEEVIKLQKIVCIREILIRGRLT